MFLCFYSHIDVFTAMGHRPPNVGKTAYFLTLLRRWPTRYLSLIAYIVCFFVSMFINCYHCSAMRQETQLSQRNRAMLRVIDNNR